MNNQNDKIEQVTERLNPEQNSQVTSAENLAEVSQKQAEKKIEPPSPPAEEKIEPPRPPVEEKIEPPRPPVEEKIEPPSLPAEEKIKPPSPPAEEKIKPPSSQAAEEAHLLQVDKKTKKKIFKYLRPKNLWQKSQFITLFSIRKSKQYPLMTIIILIPILLTTLYLFLLAKDRYVSESIVVVKQADNIGSANLNLGMILGGNASTMREDAMLLQQYILSPDMLKKMDKKLNLKESFTHSGLDVLQYLSKNASLENFLNYYRNHVSVIFDEKTSVLVINTQGFTPQFSQKFNQAILTESEQFINELSHRISREEMQFANQEVMRAHQQLQVAKGNVLLFQNDNNIVDPQAQIEITTRLVADLQAKKAQQEAELTNLLTYLQDNTPQVIALKNGIQALKEQIKKEQSVLTSVNDDQLNQKMAEFEELKAKVKFESDLYKLALTALEKSRVEAAKKTKILSVISQPYLPEDPTYPKKWYRLLTVLLICTLIYGMVKVVASIIEDHRT